MSKNKYFGDGFIKTFLPDISNSFTKYQLKKNISTAKSLAKTIPVFIVCLLFLQYTYQKNVARISEIKETSEIKGKGEYIYHIISLKKTLNSQPWYSRPYFFSLADNDLNISLDKVITLYIKTNIAPILVLFLKEQINHNLSQIDLLVESFKVYLMLYELEPISLDSIRNWYQKHLNKISFLYGVNKNTLTETFKLIDSDTLEQQSKFDEELYLKVITKLSNYSIPQIVHNMVKKKLEIHPEVNFSNIASKKLLSILDDQIFKAKIPYIFTIEGYIKYFKDKRKILNDILSSSYLVKKLGLNNLANFVNATNLLYEEEYIANWQKIWNKIMLKKINNIEEALQNLKNIPLDLPLIFKFLQQIDKKLLLVKDIEVIKNSANKVISELSPIKNNITEAVSEGLSEVVSNFLPISEDARGFIKYRALDKEAISAVEEKLKGIEGLTKLLTTILFHPSREEACFEVIKKFESAEDCPLRKAEEIFFTLPVPLDTIYGRLTYNIKNLLYQQAINHINHNWQEKVYKFYLEKIKDKYPFNVSNQNVSISDFTKFFAKEGILDKFITEYLSLKHLVISKESKRLLKLAEDIRASWFNNEGEPFVKLVFTPIIMDGRLKKVVLSMLDTKNIFTHEESSPCAFVWPNKNQMTEFLKVEFFDNKNKSTLVYQGPWIIYNFIERNLKHGETIEKVQSSLKSPLGNLDYVITFANTLPLFDRGKISLPENIVEITKTGTYDY